MALNRSAMRSARTGVHNGCRVIGVGRAQIALGYLFGIVVDIIVEGAEGVEAHGIV